MYFCHHSGAKRLAYSVRLGVCPACSWSQPRRPCGGTLPLAQHDEGWLLGVPQAGEVAALELWPELCGTGWAAADLCGPALGPSCGRIMRTG